MLLRGWNFCSTVPSRILLDHKWNRGDIISEGAHLKVAASSSSTSSRVVCVRVGMDDIREIAQNKVLIAAAVSAAIGQLSKPFTSAYFYGNKFDYKAAFQAGGFPSTHSSAAVATATMLGLDRGFSDAIFGLAVVYASLIMYDAQGVRREVGTHAKALNRVLFNARLNSVPSTDADDLLIDSSGKSSSGTLLSEEPSSLRSKPTNASLLARSDDRMTQRTSVLISPSLSAQVKRGLENGGVAHGCSPLKDSVGHTEIEVIAGALLGFFVSLAVYDTVQ